MRTQQNSNRDALAVKPKKLGNLQPRALNIVHVYKIDNLQHKIGEDLLKVVFNQYRLMNKPLCRQDREVYSRLCLQSNQSTIHDLTLLNDYLRKKLIDAPTADNKYYAEIGKAIIARQRFAKFAAIDKGTKQAIHYLLRNTKLIINSSKKQRKIAISQ